MRFFLILPLDLESVQNFASFGMHIDKIPHILSNFPHFHRCPKIAILNIGYILFGAETSFGSSFG
jgi:hypothetical protein